MSVAAADDDYQKKKKKKKQRLQKATGVVAVWRRPTEKDERIDRSNYRAGSFQYENVW